MNRTLFLYLICLFIGESLFSQRVVDITYSQNAKGAYVFSAINLGFCNYILDIHFTSFDNVTSDQPLPYHGEIRPGTNRLFSLSPVHPNDPVKFNYATGFHKGCMHPTPDTGLVYLLPSGPNKEVQAYEMNSPVSAGEPDVKQNGWYVIRLRMKPGDTIYAARKGVVNVVEDSDGSNDAGGGGPENYIEVVQADCSFARYGILRKNSALVKPGEPVKAGQPIGLVGGDTYGRGSDIRFSVFYTSEKDTAVNGAASWEIFRNYIPLIFWTKNNGKGKLKHGATYTAEFPVTILNQELPKPKPVGAKKRPGAKK
ncbi:MAG TPA: M23 family metallopeptidase [Puia sp.]|nr:M23 family metallopeptidase [Puia sp.]